METCRACSNIGCEMLVFDAISLDNYNLLTSLTVKIGDSLPQCLCQICWGAVEYFINFRNKCIRTEASLKEALINELIVKSEKVKSVAPETSDVNIKQEPNEEDTFEIDFLNESYFDDDDDKQNLNWLQTSLDNLKTEIEPKTRKSNRIKCKKHVIKDKNNKVSKPVKVIKTKVKEIVKLHCGLCNNSYVDKDSLRVHVEKHKKGTQCSICNETFKTWQKLISHRIKHIEPIQRKCHICDKKCMVDFYLEYHYLKYHHDKEFTGIPCNSCSFLAKSPRNLSKHHWYMHSGRSLPCPVCSEVFINNSGLRNHMKKHSDVRQYTCELCGYSCKQSGNMQDHKLRKHSEQKFTCRKCQRLFKTEELFKGHTCRPQRLCTICGKSFHHAGMFNRHLRRHSNDKPYKCELCSESFKSKSYLVIHLNKHQGNRTEKCEHCPAKFYYKSALIKHRRTHTGEKPYVCKVCDKGFTGNNNLKVHMKVHGEMLIIKKNTVDDKMLNIFK